MIYFLSLPNLHRRNPSEFLSQVSKPQKVSKVPKTICHLIDSSIYHNLVDICFIRIKRTKSDTMHQIGHNASNHPVP